MTSAGKLPLGIAAALGGLATLALLGDSRAPSSPVPTARESLPERPAALVSPPAPPGERGPELRVEPPTMPVDPGPALRELVTLLQDEAFDEAGFHLAARALAGTLGNSAGPTMLASLEAAAGPAELVAAAELLAALGSSGTGPSIALPAPALARLRWVACGEPGAQGDLAAQALAALGTRADTAMLLAELADGDAPRRTRARRALERSRDPELARHLADLVATRPGAQVLEEVVILAARSGQESALVRALRAELVLGAGTPELAPGVVARIRRLVQDPGHEPSGAELLALPPRLCEDPTPEVASLLQATLRDASLPAAGRLAAAETVARARQPLDERTRALAADVLRESLADGDPAVRRRALSALGSTNATALVARHAREDEDPSVRAAAVRALRSSAPESRRALLGDLARFDASTSVRALAAHELRWLESGADLGSP